MIDTIKSSPSPQFTPQGFLADFESWTPEIAASVAKAENLELSPCHWEAIEFLRDFYATYRIPPSAHMLKHTLGDQLKTAVPCTHRRLSALFPNGGCKQACRIAGLPDYFCHSC